MTDPHVWENEWRLAGIRETKADIWVYNSVNGCVGLYQDTALVKLADILRISSLFKMHAAAPAAWEWGKC